jgi:AcrR family transcriptional regulator
VSPDVRSRLLDATFVCLARVGIAKTSVDDIAREAGCSRATLYRHFGGKPELLRALRDRELVRLEAALAAAVEPTSELAPACRALVVEAAEFLLDHPVLGTILALEPSLVAPLLTLGQADEFLRGAVELVAPNLARFLPDETTRLRASELLVRITLSHLQSPDPNRSVTDPQVAQFIVDQYIVPGFVGEPATGRKPS